MLFFNGYSLGRPIGMHIDKALIPHSLFIRAPEVLNVQAWHSKREGPPLIVRSVVTMVTDHRSSLNNKCELESIWEMGESKCDSTVF